MMGEVLACNTASKYIAITISASTLTSLWTTRKHCNFSSNKTGMSWSTEKINLKEWNESVNIC